MRAFKNKINLDFVFLLDKIPDFKTEVNKGLCFQVSFKWEIG